jgi:uracil phosphoribosyltransferase
MTCQLLIRTAPAVPTECLAGMEKVASQHGHPVLLHKIIILRSSSTPPASFRAVLREVTYHLGYEATSSLTTRPVAITVPFGKEHVEASGHKLVERVSLIPILGLGMVDPLLELLPNAAIHHIGA